jgi:hypothetical protein
VILVLPIEAVAVSETLVGAPRALSAKRLIICDVCGKSSNFGKIHSFQNPHELFHAVFPSHPATMCCIQIHSDLWRLLHQLVKGIRYALPVGCLGGRTPTMWVRHVGSQVWEAVRFHNNHNWHTVLVVTKHLNKRVGILLLIFSEAFGAVTPSLIIATAIRILVTTDLPI